MILNRPFPINRAEQEYDPAEFAAVTAAIENAAKDDPAAQKFLAAWREGAAMLDAQDRDCMADEIATSRPKTSASRRASRLKLTNQKTLAKTNRLRTSGA